VVSQITLFLCHITETVTHTGGFMHYKITVAVKSILRVKLGL